MKKSTKIILPALAVLVLGTAAAATGTVAWFASNGLVTADGMHVQCTTAKNLLISNVAPEEMTTDSYGVAVTSTHAAVTEIAPSSTTEESMATGTPKFFKTDSVINAVTGNVVEAVPETDTAAKKAGTTISAAEEGNGNGYVKHSFWLMAQSTTDLNLSIESITFSDALNNYISQALRMGIYYVDGTDSSVHSEIFNLGANGDTSYAGFNGGTSGTTVGELTAVALSDAGKVTSASIGSEVVTATVTPAAYSSAAGYSLGKILSTKTSKEIAESTWSRVDLYFWYEGQDSHCTANDALNIQPVDITVKFQGVASTTPSTGA